MRDFFVFLWGFVPNFSYLLSQAFGGNSTAFLVTEGLQVALFIIVVTSIIVVLWASIPASASDGASGTSRTSGASTRHDSTVGSGHDEIPIE